MMQSYDRASHVQLAVNNEVPGIDLIKSFSILAPEPLVVSTCQNKKYLAIVNYYWRQFHTKHRTLETSRSSAPSDIVTVIEVLE